MPQGLQINDDNGTSVIDTDTRAGSFFGQVATNGGNGSITDARLVGRKLCAFAANTGNNNAYGGPFLSLNATSGQLSWRYEITQKDWPNMPGPSFRQHIIFYGAY